MKSGDSISMLVRIKFTKFVVLVTFIFLLHLQWTIGARLPGRISRQSSTSFTPSRSNIRSFFATSTLGLEGALAKEIKEKVSDAINIVKSSGGVTFDVKSESGDRAAFESLLHLRSCLRFMEKIIEAPTNSINHPAHLYDFISSFDWATTISTLNSIKCDVILGQDLSSSLTHSHYSALTVKNAIVDQFRDKLGVRPNVNTEDPDVIITVYLHRGGAIAYKVWSGEPSMHKRGYRVTGNHKAALRETTAAGLLILSGWDHTKRQVLCDPMMGSGTFLIEAALMAADTAVGLLRYGKIGGGTHESRQGYNQLPPPVSVSTWEGVSKDVYNDVYDQALANDKRDQLGNEECFLFGSDHHPGAVTMARVGADNSGTSHLIDFSCADAGFYMPKYKPRYVITNPPWDIRLEGAEESWIKLGDFITHVREMRGGAEKDKDKDKDKDNDNVDGEVEEKVDLWALSGSPEVVRHLGLPPRNQVKIKSAGLEQRMINF